VPRVVAFSAPEAAAQFLVLQLVESGRPAPDFDERLGRGLAALHRFGAPGFGLDHDNFVGRLPQSNAAAPTWPAFYRERRLEAQLRRAADGGLASDRMRRGFDRLFAALEDLVGPAEPPARLHGDLWGGNVMADAQGRAWLIDPSAYGGHREIDLAMLRLFGAPSGRIFSAYEEAAPLAEGHADRVGLYQLLPLLVHAVLFGGSYIAAAESMAARYAG